MTTSSEKLKSKRFRSTKPLRKYGKEIHRLKGKLMGTKNTETCVLKTPQ
jgi:hypothetical protein